MTTNRARRGYKRQKNKLFRLRKSDQYNVTRKTITIPKTENRLM